MAIKFKRTTTGIDFEYQSDRQSNNWVWRELTEKRWVAISYVFHFGKRDLIDPPSKSARIDEDHWYRFTFGSFEGEYVRIPGRVLDIPNDVLFPANTKFLRKTFAAERNISIFGRMARLLDHTNPIVIGGEQEGAIPLVVFEELLEKFPNSYEVDRYAEARVTTVLSQYLDGMADARAKYENYFKRRMAGSLTSKMDLDFLNKFEVEKYLLIRKAIKEALDDKMDLPEGDWQDLMISFLLLLFPKYIKVLKNVAIADYYSNPEKKTSRFIDIALVDANGNLDVIEIKKPFEDKILRKSPYRGNSIPTSELSGTIMQAEKYLFHLSKWGVQGEKKLTSKYADDLPKGMSIRLSNPKAIIIVGRDQIGGGDMTGSQLLDFEVIKRKYSNMMDIITYDDLLRRLDTTIVALGGETVITRP